MVRRGRRLCTIAGALLFALVVCELAVRAIAQRDEAGQLHVLGLPLPPDRLPLSAVAAGLDRYARSKESFLAYDPALGWSPRPGARTRDGLARANAAGIRSDVEIAPDPPPGVSRVEIFGDSLTFGDEVALDQTWGFILERTLGTIGFRPEVLNFGVNAYGMDQAYLRWREVGRRFRPSVVVFGFQPENALRNLNLFRALYFAGTEVPLSKPRFVVRDGQLALVNAPAVPPERILPSLEGLGAEPLAAYERFVPPRREERWWMRSRLAALAAAIADRMTGRARPLTIEELGRDPEAIDLAGRIVARFAEEVTADGAEFVVVHLPRRDELEAIAMHRESWDARLVAAVNARALFLSPQELFFPLRDDDFRPAGHYAARLNELVAQALIIPVSRALCERTPPDTRPTACPPR